MKRFLILFLSGGYVVLTFLLIQLPDRQFHFYFLNIGQGDAILIKTPENHQILVDGGPENRVIEELGDVLPFFDKTLDMVIMTHPHDDHIAGLIEVLRRFEVENVLLTGAGFDSFVYAEFLKEVELEGANLLFAEAETDYIFGSVFLDIIYPFYSVAGERFENINNSSVAMKVIYKDHRILLTGDLEEEVELELVEANVELEAEILKAGHHGSRSSSSENFLRKVRPKTVVIQSEEDNSYGHPHPESLRNFYRAGVESILRNDLDGRIEIVF